MGAHKKIWNKFRRINELLSTSEVQTKLTYEAFFEVLKKS